MTIYTAKDRTPYTYFIRWNDLNLNYYGRRTAKGCHPEEFFILYFTSSKYVEETIDDFGMPDVIKIHKIFSDIDPCKIQEEKFLNRVNAAKSLNWLNQKNSDKEFDRTGIISPRYIDTQTKISQTWLINYGVENCFQSEIIKNKIAHSKLERYGDANYRNSKKINQTKLERYNDINYNNREKCNQTKLKNHGDINYNNREKANSTFLKKFGCHPLQSPEIRAKAKKTMFETTGYDHPNKVPFLSIIETRKTYPKTSISRYFSDLKQFY